MSYYFDIFSLKYVYYAVRIKAQCYAHPEAVLLEVISGVMISY